MSQGPCGRGGTTPALADRVCRDLHATINETGSVSVSASSITRPLFVLMFILISASNLRRWIMVWAPPGFLAESESGRPHRSVAKPRIFAWPINSIALALRRRSFADASDHRNPPGPGLDGIVGGKSEALRIVIEPQSLIRISLIIHHCRHNSLAQHLTWISRRIDWALRAWECCRPPAPRCHADASAPSRA